MTNIAPDLRAAVTAAAEREANWKSTAAKIEAAYITDLRKSA